LQTGSVPGIFTLAAELIKLTDAIAVLNVMNTFAMVMPGPTEWVLILAIVLVLFGAKKLPELARSIGQGMNEFRKVREDFDKELHQAGQDLKIAPQGNQANGQGQQVQTTRTPQTDQPTQPS
jgi:sec-independent protein translocase protein TatA